MRGAGLSYPCNKPLLCLCVARDSRFLEQEFAVAAVS
jgi:hypothetical protein